MADVDRNLLFAVIALQDDFIDPKQLADICAGWAVRMDEPLAALLIERGWITAADRDEVERKLERKLKKHRGDAHATLGAVADAQARDAIRMVDAPEIRKSLTSLPPAAGYVLVQTLVPPTEENRTRYHLTRLHAEGGLGKVWVARDGDLNREVALKEIKPEGAAHPDAWRRFLKEAQITGQLEHPNIVPVYELARRKEDDQPFYVMRLVRGQTLREAIAEFHRRKGQGPPDRLELQGMLTAFVSVCQAIGYAHSRGIVHRDLKPENVVLGGFGEVIVLDWGLAKMVDQPDDVQPGGASPLSVSADAETAKTQGQVGTPAYMAPEQVEARHDLIDARTDVYGLGGILFEILTGRVPAEGRTTAEIYPKILAGAIPRVRDLEPTMPKPLEAIVVKATAVDRAGRYARAADLAEDIGRWIADEPVSAWREPWTTRTRRWAGRHRTAVTAAAAALVVAAAGMTFLSYESRLRAARRRTEASGRVDALITAQIRAIPAVVAQLGADRQLVRDRLRRLARGEGYAGRGRLPAALALLPDEPAQAEFLAGRLLDPLATPDEVLIIREALIAHRANEAVAPRCRAALPRGVVALTDTQLRAAGALAGMTPSDPAWTALADPIARKLARENPLHLGTWREIFAPIAPRLAGSLRKVFADRKAPEARDRAFTFLFEFATAPTNKTQADDLAALVGDSDPDYFTEVLGRLADPLLRERALAVLEPQIRTPAQFDDTLARRQGRIAMALLRLGRAEAVWPLFRHRDDPGVRTELVHNLARFGFDPAPVVARLGAEPDVSAQRALILCIGQFPPDAVADRPALASRLLVRYRVDSDPGVHGGIDWLLRQHWGRATDLEKIDKELSGQRPPRGHGWYVNGQGQTFAIFRDPVEFRMGSTRESDPEREENEAPHLRRIGRSFALATREVTLAEYGRFLDNRPDSNEDLRDNPQFRRDIRSPDCAVGALRWYKAAQYCNWLSGREGLPEDQWCYPEKIEPGMKLPADHLKRTGYRLPTEAEWEYACRAGAVSSRPYGGSKAWLPEFGWFDLSASGMMHPTGQKEPNDSGLFDMLGNAFEWCGDSYKDYPKSQFGDPVIDEITDVEYSDKFARVMRGGSFNYPATNLRSAYRDRYRPADRNTYYGVRPARTYP